MDIQPHCNDLQYIVKACTAAAKSLGVITNGENVTFDKGYPKCLEAWIQLQSDHGATRVRAKLLVCCIKQGVFSIGKGQDGNNVMGYSCEDDTCYPKKQLSGV
ncbi:hypothetical protein U1Q18_047851 [Sarracenia purpurea var. burkii]